jgi:hypothetical protein
MTNQIRLALITLALTACRQPPDAPAPTDVVRHLADEVGGCDVRPASCGGCTISPSVDGVRLDGYDIDRHALPVCVLPRVDATFSVGVGNATTADGESLVIQAEGPRSWALEASRPDQVEVVADGRPVLIRRGMLTEVEATWISIQAVGPSGSELVELLVD